MDIVVSVIEGIMLLLSTLISALLVFQLVLSLFGFKRKTRDYEDHEPQMRFLVLVPAHNEEAVIADIINNLNSMDYPRELYDFYILADNCTDRTAEVARSMGAKVILNHRESPDEPTGKPIVLQKALEALDGYQNQYDLVMFFDADNLMDVTMFREVNSQFLSHPGKADIIQCYLGCKNNKGPVALSDYMSYTITNRFMQYAKYRLGLNAGIGGTGFAVYAPYLHQRGGWTSMSLTEDFELQIEATCEGRKVLWNNQVRVYDEKPTRLRACARQRTRWAQGHWYVAFKNTPRMFKALFQGKISLWEFLSTLFAMYNLAPFVILVIELILGLAIDIFRWTGLIAPEATTISVSSFYSLNLPGILLFLYSLVFLYYVGDWMDNRRHPHLTEIPCLLVSVLINTFVSGFTHVLGLFKYRQQNNWVKTDHSIKRSNSIAADLVEQETQTDTAADA